MSKKTEAHIQSMGTFSTVIYIPRDNFIQKIGLFLIFLMFIANTPGLLIIMPWIYPSKKRHCGLVVKAPAS